MITDSWIEGSFKTFDAFQTRYLFSCATILAISSLLGGTAADGVNARADFDLAADLLKKLRDAGSFTATEFCQHIEAIKADMQGYSSETRDSPCEMALGTTAETQREQIQGSLSHLPSDYSHNKHNVSGQMALSEPSLEAFLLQNQTDPGQIDQLLDDMLFGGLNFPNIGAT
jgi:hypothetical protein